MYHVKVSTKKYGDEIYDLDVTSDSTGYEYGLKLADVLGTYMEEKVNADIEVTDDHGWTIHKLAIVPKKDGVMVTENSAGLMPLTNADFKKNEETMPEKYLIMVNPEQNNNKFYRMKDFGNGTWGAYYGRIGENQDESPYSSHVAKPYVYKDYMYGIKLKEKLIKGYEDKSECHNTFTEKKVEKKKQGFSSIKDPDVSNLISELMRYADRTVEENYSVSSADVSKKMISEAKKELRAMRGVKKTSTFNKHLLELMHIIPRRINGKGSYGVQSLMAGEPGDFAKIIEREESLLDVMEGQVNIHKASEEDKDEKDLLEAMGIEVYVARPEQKAQVLDRMSDMLKPKVRNVYRVINHRTQKAFDDYLGAQKEKPAVKQFWHGSRNENWISILQNGLLLRPDAHITGKMFGDGIYFAPSSMKSWGYTSSSSARWTNEHSDSAFMALYATAYGKPYEAEYRDNTSWHGYSYERLKKEHPDCSCVHAKADKMYLQNDEVIFYREDQITINYLVEFSA